jgi:inorganic pyrophosphatase
VLDMLDEGIPDHKILAVPVREPRSQPIVDIDDVPEHTRREIEHFFEIYKELEGKSAIMQGFRSAGSARNIVSQSRSRYLAEAPSSAMS